jgi:hypothetical protein
MPFSQGLPVGEAMFQVFGLEIVFRFPGLTLIHQQRKIHPEG